MDKSKFLKKIQALVKESGGSFILNMENKKGSPVKRTQQDIEDNPDILEQFVLRSCLILPTLKEEIGNDYAEEAVSPSSGPE